MKDAQNILIESLTYLKARLGDDHFMTRSERTFLENLRATGRMTHSDRFALLNPALNQARPNDPYALDCGAMPERK